MAKGCQDLPLKQLGQPLRDGRLDSLRDFNPHVFLDAEVAVPNSHTPHGSLYDAPEGHPMQAKNALKIPTGSA